MSEVLAMLLDWATREGEDLRLFTFDFNKFFDRQGGLSMHVQIQIVIYEAVWDMVGACE